MDLRWKRFQSSILQRTDTATTVGSFPTDQGWSTPSFHIHHFSLSCSRTKLTQFFSFTTACWASSKWSENLTIFILLLFGKVQETVESFVKLFSDSCFCGKAKHFLRWKPGLAEVYPCSCSWREQSTDSTQSTGLRETGEAQARDPLPSCSLSPWRCGNRLATDQENFTWVQPQPFYAADGSTQPSPAIRTGILRVYSTESRMIIWCWVHLHPNSEALRVVLAVIGLHWSQGTGDSPGAPRDPHHTRRVSIPALLCYITAGVKPAQERPEGKEKREKVRLHSNGFPRGHPAQLSPWPKGSARVRALAPGWNLSSPSSIQASFTAQKRFFQRHFLQKKVFKNARG